MLGLDETFARRSFKLVMLAEVTPIDSRGVRAQPVTVNLAHVLWMEPRPEGTMLYLNQWDAGNGSGALLNAEMLVAESELDILQGVLH